MATEQTLIPALAAATGVTVRALHAEQLDDLNPAQVPLIIISRVGSYWSDWDTFCAGNTDLADVTIEVDYIDKTLEGARRLADIGRKVLAAEAQSSPESEFDVWESSLRVYRVTALFNIPDYEPEIV